MILTAKGKPFTHSKDIFRDKNMLHVECVWGLPPSVLFACVSDVQAVRGRLKAVASTPLWSGP